MSGRPSVSRRAATVLVTLLIALLAVSAQAAPALAGAARDGATTSPGTLVVQVVPPVAGAVVAVDGHRATSNAAGIARVPVDNFVSLASRLRVVPTVAGDIRTSLGYPIGSVDGADAGRPVRIGLAVQRLVRWQFTDPRGTVVPAGRVSSMQFTGSDGHSYRLDGSALAAPKWLPAGRVAMRRDGLTFVPFEYRIDEVTMDDSNVVNHGQQAFAPMRSTAWQIHLLIFSLNVTTKDWLLGGQTGTAVVLTGPDGRAHRGTLTGSGASFTGLARGSYSAVVTGPRWRQAQPLILSHDDAVALTVVSTADLVIVGAGLPLIAVAVLAAGFWLRRRRKRSGELPPGGPTPADESPPGRRSALEATAPQRMATIVVVLVLALASLSLAGPARAGAATAGAGDSATSVAALPPVPIWAYYYIWYDPSSWVRAKQDLPLLGGYSSDDPAVMRTHISEAKAAGIDGFVVSWKDTSALDRRLDQLVRIAAAQQFRLEIAYEALDFQRNPLPVGKIVADLDSFATRYASNPVFASYGPPLIVWEGIDSYSLADVRRVASAVGGKLQLVASSKSVADYERVAPMVAGEAYYWSSVDPAGPGVQQKLDALSKAVHDHGQLWLAPAAPGYDARLLGGHRVIPRDGGQTLRSELREAYASAPDAVALISWNEFSEGTYVEPSQDFGRTALGVLAAAHGFDGPLRASGGGGVDSSAEGSSQTGFGAPLALALSGVLMGIPGAMALRRRGRRLNPAGRGH